MPQGLSWSSLTAPWVVLGCLGALLQISGAIWLRFLAKLGRRWSQDGRKMGQVAPKMCHDGAKMAILGSVWQLLGGILGAFLVTFFAIFGKIAEV